MIYLVSRNKSLYSPKNYTDIPFAEAMKILNPLQNVQFDTETQGLDAHSKALLTVQLGNKENQVVFDWTTLVSEEKRRLKEYFESERTFIGWNLLFDLGFMYKQNIWPKHIWDGMIAEKLIWLGYPAGMHEMSLKAAAKNYLDYDLDKTVRGKIVNEGLTEEVIVYAAGDVMWIEDIKIEQEKELTKQSLHKAVVFECEFLKSLAYFKHCGVHLNVKKWKAKMEKDLARLQAAEKALNDWVVNWCLDQKIEGYSETVLVDYVVEHYGWGNDKKYKLNLPEGSYLVGKRTVGYSDQTSALVYTYKVPTKHAFVFKDLQGNLFTGFEDLPKCTINWSSSQQVIKFFEVLGVELKTFDKKTKKEKKSVEEKQIAPQKDRFEIIPLFLEYQKASKVVSTYGQNWLDAVNKSTGRIHPDYNSLGADTGRITSGGGLTGVNAQNLPHDAETRACFTAEEGNKLVCIDYMSQESRIIASVCNDKAMIDIFERGCGDVHSLVAYGSYPNIIPRDTKIEDIKKLYPQARQDAKGIEFAVNYGGDANTIANNKGIPIEEAKVIYDNFMSSFPGVKQYQDYCRKAVMEHGYILLNNVFLHRAHIYDWEELKKIEDKFKEDGFWDYYREMKKSAPSCDTVQSVKQYFKRKSASEKQSINYRIQARGACCFKLASIKFFNWIVANNYLNKVKMCIPVHDEFLLECPEELAEEVLRIITKCMEDGAKPFCDKVFLGADGGIYDHWVH